MGDARDICPHLDSIGEVTKEDLLLKSKVEEQSSGSSAQPRAVLCSGTFMRQGSMALPPALQSLLYVMALLASALKLSSRHWVLLPLISLDKTP